ncbi:hypothetical protein RASY3_14160 [Ruminococcus albus SY3]|uniref:Uncharacterized protein n=1 Tax=Ruminococcus albus SY3 TaxID=1341156 RepID=A0A011WNA9_RUMAL|nr:hypothetical protein [Ruminococcus albus]EXM38480.1 hypothetical protein RASY3_14160 [Ruminococcus albus SY3]
MSVNIKQPNGSLKKIAGNTILLDATCSEIRSGTFSIQCQGDSGANVTITFETPMSDTDYVVIFESDSPAAGEIGFRNKTTTGFNLYVLGGRGDTTTYTFTGNYYAFRLVELEGYNAIYNKMTNIDVSPTENSTNLVTSGGVYDAIKNASSVFIGTSSEWESETSKTDYQVAILTDKPNVNAVDSTDGSTTVVGEPNKRWVGTQAEWGNLTTAEKAEYEVVCFADSGDAPPATQFATISSESVVSTVGDYICSKNGKNVCVMLKGHTNGIVTNSTKLYSGFFNPLTPNNYAYLDIPFAIRNRTTNVTEMRMGYLDATGNFYTSAYTEDIASDWDIQLFFSYQTK